MPWVFFGSAFQMTSEGDWLKQTDLAVTFLDRYGAEVVPQPFVLTQGLPRAAGPATGGDG